MRIQVKLFGKFRSFSPAGPAHNVAWLDMEPGRKLEDIFVLLGIAKDEPKTIVRNAYIARATDSLTEGDVVAIFPPMGVSG